MATHNIGGGIDTQNLSSAVVTHVTGSDAKPVREQELRNRFLTFEPIFDSTRQVVARELVLSGIKASVVMPPEIQRMNEDMLLTGLYSLIQDNLIGEQPLFVQISRDVLFSDALPQLYQPAIVWAVENPDAESTSQAMELARSSGMQFCLDGRLQDTTASNWAYHRIDAARTEIKPQAAKLIVRRVSQENDMARWPRSAWFMGELFTGMTKDRSSRPELELRLELATISVRQSLDSLIQFVRLNPALEPQLMRIAHSAGGGLAQKTDSCAHALIRLGSQRAQRVGLLTALAGPRLTADNRLYAQVGFSRGLLMGKLGLQSKLIDNPGHAFEAGLFSTFPAAFAQGVNQLYRRLGMERSVYEALAGLDTPIKKLLHLAHACEHNKTLQIRQLANVLQIPLESITTAHLESVVAAEDMASQLI